MKKFFSLFSNFFGVTDNLKLFDVVKFILGLSIFLLIFSLIITYALNYLSFVIYHINLTFALFLSNFLAPTSVMIIQHSFNTVVLLYIASVIYGIYKK